MKLFNLDEADKGYEGEVAQTMKAVKLAVNKAKRDLRRNQAGIRELEELEDLDDQEKDELLGLERAARAARFVTVVLQPHPKHGANRSILDQEGITAAPVRVSY